MTKPTNSSRVKTTETQEDIVGKAMKKVMNSHGYPFQESVASAIKRLNTRSSWFPLALEFPVQVQGHGTRIDIVLTDFPVPSIWSASVSEPIPPWLIGALPGHPMDLVQQ
jgi:hypothetical protein